jgi:hypothetical protein
MFLLHEWIPHEGLVFYGIFTKLSSACEAGAKVDPLVKGPFIAEIEVDTKKYMNDAGTYAFDKLYDLSGNRIKN